MEQEHSARGKDHGVQPSGEQPGTGIWKHGQASPPGPGFRGGEKCRGSAVNTPGIALSGTRTRPTAETRKLG